MPYNIESATLGAVSLALDAASLRHQAISSNIANAGTPGYRPVAVSFEEHLGALRAALSSRGTVDASLLAASSARVEREPEKAGGTEEASRVAVDEQVAQLSQNAVHYQALLRALNKQYSILSIAINEGKR